MPRSDDNYASVIRRVCAYAVDALILFIAFPMILGAICGFVLYLTIGLDWMQNGFLILNRKNLPTEKSKPPLIVSGALPVPGQAAEEVFRENKCLCNIDNNRSGCKVMNALLAPR